MSDITPIEVITSKIYFIRKEKIMLDRDLASLYQVETRVLNQAVQRNLKRFPHDFMFQLNSREFEILKSQIVTSSWGGTRKLPYAFTELGVAMLSSVLNSDLAIDVNIQIMRVFNRLKKYLSSNEELRRMVEEHDQKINSIMRHIQNIIDIDEKPKRQIGFKPPETT